MGLAWLIFRVFIVGEEVPGEVAHDGHQECGQEGCQPLHPAATLILIVLGGAGGLDWRAVRSRSWCGSADHFGRLLVFFLVDVHARCSGDLPVAQALQIAGHLPSGLIAIRRVLGHSGKYYRIDIDALGRSQRGIRDEIRRRGRLFLHMLIRNRKGGFALKRSMASKRLVEHTAQRIDIGAGIRVLTAGLLRGKVLGGADNGGSLRHRRGGVIQCTGDAEVHHLHLAGVGEHDICWFDIAVNNPGFVRGLQCIGYRFENIRRFLGGQSSVLANDISQGAAVDPLHDDIWDGHAIQLGFAGVINRHDIGVIQLARVLGLAVKALTEVDVARHFRAEHLYRYLAA